MHQCLMESGIVLEPNGFSQLSVQIHFPLTLPMVLMGRVVEPEKWLTSEHKCG